MLLFSVLFSACQPTNQVAQALYTSDFLEETFHADTRFNFIAKRSGQIHVKDSAGVYVVRCGCLDECSQVETWKDWAPSKVRLLRHKDQHIVPRLISVINLSTGKEYRYDNYESVGCLRKNKIGAKADYQQLLVKTKAAVFPESASQRNTAVRVHGDYRLTIMSEGKALEVVCGCEDYCNKIKTWPLWEESEVLLLLPTAEQLKPIAVRIKNLQTGYEHAFKTSAPGCLIN